MSPYPNLWRLRKCLLMLVAGGWTAVAAQRWRSLFGLYAGLTAIKGLQWLAQDAGVAIPAYRWTEPFLLLVNVAAVLEAWWGVARYRPAGERRMAFLGLLAVGLGAGLLAGLGEPDANATREFVRRKLQVHVGMMAFCGGWLLTRLGARASSLYTQQLNQETGLKKQAVGAGVLALHHFRVLTLREFSWLTDLIRYAGTAHPWRWWYCQQGLFLSLTLTCLWLWLRPAALIGRFIGRLWLRGRSLAGRLRRRAGRYCRGFRLLWFLWHG